MPFIHSSSTYEEHGHTTCVQPPISLPGSPAQTRCVGTLLSRRKRCGKVGRSRQTALLVDLDGTLVTSVYQHVLAWRIVLEAEGIDLSVRGIHRIGLSGGLFINDLLRETEGGITPEQIDRVRFAHVTACNDLAAGTPPASRQGAAHPDDGRRCAVGHFHQRPLKTAGHVIASLEIPDGVPVITRDRVAHAKPDPDLFEAAAERLGGNVELAIVVGDSVWDLLAARRARALGVGLHSGGYSADELPSAGSYRVDKDSADHLLHLDEIGVRRAV